MFEVNDLTRIALVLAAAIPKSGRARAATHDGRPCPPQAVAFEHGRSGASPLPRRRRRGGSLGATTRQ